MASRGCKAGCQAQGHSPRMTPKRRGLRCLAWPVRSAPRTWMKRSRICCLGRWRLTKQAADCFKHSRFADKRWKRFGRLVRDGQPDAHFTCLQIVKSTACGLHVDAEDVGPSWAVAVAFVHLHRIHCASTRLCIPLAFIGQERAWPSTSHALCVIVPVLLPRRCWARTR